jgi:hypothetical protein
MIQNIVTEVAGLVGVLPKIIYIETNDTIAQVTATGYLDNAAKQGYQFSEYDMALVSTKTSPSATDPQLALFQISIVPPHTSLVSLSGPGSVALPTIVNHIATFTNTAGAIGEDASTAINGGNIQAGLSGTAGYLASFPSTLAKGSLRIVAVANTNDTLVTISNALHGQASVYSIPDSGASTANFIISKLTGTQHITVGALQVDAGVISSGLATGGTAGGFIAYPATSANGSLRLTPVGNAGNFAVSISNVSTQGQATVMSIPDVAAATGQFVVKTAAFVSGNLIQASGTAGLTIDSGIASSDVQLKSQVVAQQSADIGGAGAGPIDIAVTGATAASVAVATVLSSSNAVSILKVVPGSAKISVTFSGDPGASAIINYIVYIAAQ